MPHQADINPYMNKNNSYHENVIPNKAGYNAKVGRNDFNLVNYKQERNRNR